jgi:hypothetical protein
MVAGVRLAAILAVVGAVLCIGCRSGADLCASIALDTPLTDLDTRPAFSLGTPRNPRGPVDAVLCCLSCRNSVRRCSADCTEPFYRDGMARELPGSMETYDGYPELSSEWAICQVWAFNDRVGAVWWAPMY